ncbi:MAG: SUMF1/EgtB/PvdO family nonheme iron enzyme [Magnetococcales bacterium]|nr:SUMF1/EgtB/PvdO family nonheme iron enzyme [Magnetococcales bacterium]MBF0149471.1 SUMF1/EgtB/PvdO family nonheme iron enzyme [Magnetococcales bacterium]
MNRPFVSQTSEIDTAWHPLADGSPPLWASGWGEDRWGVFVEFAIGEVRQRLRWIPPGRFWMGSPVGEPGRFEDEGPRHEVTIEKGYWLFDTPCTQALWQAVMDGNPSRFITPDRPVEQVSWDDVQTFLKRINDQLPGLNLVLPSEAQWEYACRARTTTALYTGGIEILGEHNAPVLDPIAWYGGNSGVDYELDDGSNSTVWSEKQYPHMKAGTHPVGLKAPNPWGLYDMLGNVWEWCDDCWHESYHGAPTDGTSWLDKGETGGSRVFLGGSWRDGARFVRASFRSWSHVDSYSDNVGFRCARVHP